MDERSLDKLKILLTGIETDASRDVMRLLASDGAIVTAADTDQTQLDRLERDAGLYRTTVDTARVELYNLSEVRLWEGALRWLGQLPHFIICCCNARLGLCIGTAETRIAPGKGVRGQRKAPDCPATFAIRVLKPCLFLHIEPRRSGALDRALTLIRYPTLRGVLERSPGRTVFSSQVLIPYVRIASHLYTLKTHPGIESSIENKTRPSAVGVQRGASK